MFRMQDGPEYFEPVGGLLTFDMQGIQGLVNSSAPPDYQAGGAPSTLEGFQKHFELVHLQLQQVPSLSWTATAQTPKNPEP